MRTETRIKNAISRLKSAESHLNFQLNEKKGHYTKFGLKSARFDIRNAITLLRRIDELQNNKKQEEEIKNKINILRRELRGLK